MRHFVNLHFDMVEGKKFVLAAFPKARAIGERYRAWVVQFPSVAAAGKAVEAYRVYLIALGYEPGGNYADSTAYVDHGNYSVKATSMAKLSAGFLYYNKTAG